MDHTPAAGRRARRRTVLSCVPCRVRKIKCDRTLPICESCKRRGLAHKCNWGDERDDLSGSFNAVTTANSMSQRMHGHICNDQHTIVQPSLHSTDPSLYHKSLSPARDANHNKVRASNMNGFTEMHNHTVSMSSLGRTSVDSNEWKLRLSALPPRVVVNKVVDFFVEYVDVQLNCVNSTLLRLQLNQFFKLIENGSRDGSGALSVSELESPFWKANHNWGFVALVFGILAGTCCNLSEPYMQELGVIGGPGQASDKTYAFFDSAMYFLAHCRYVETPTLWALQAMIMIRTFFFAAVKIRDVVLWQSMIVRLAQSMALHRLGSAVLDVRRPSNKSKRSGAPESFSGNFDQWSDLSTTDTNVLLEKIDSLRVGYFFGINFEPNNLAAREVARKIWTGIVLQEAFYAAHIDHCYNVKQDMMSTAPPADLEEDEVLTLDLARQTNPSALEQRLLQKRPTRTSIISASVPFINSILRQVDLENAHSMHTGHVFLDYQTIQELDLEARHAFESIPDYFRGTKQPLPDHIQKTHEEYPFIAHHAMFIEDQYHIRLLRLHFSYLVQGMHDTEFRHSTEVCIESARALVSCLGRMSPEQSMTPFGDIMHRQAYFAVVVLHVATCYGNGAFSSPEITEDIRFALKAIKKRRSKVYVSHNAIFLRALTELSDIYLSPMEPVCENHGQVRSHDNLVSEDPLQWLSTLGYAHLFSDMPPLEEFLAVPNSN